MSRCLLIVASASAVLLVASCNGGAEGQNNPNPGGNAAVQKPQVNAQPPKPVAPQAPAVNQKPQVVAPVAKPKPAATPAQQPAAGKGDQQGAAAPGTPAPAATITPTIYDSGLVALTITADPQARLVIYRTDDSKKTDSGTRVGELAAGKTTLFDETANTLTGKFTYTAFVNGDRNNAFATLASLQLTAPTGASFKVSHAADFANWAAIKGAWSYDGATYTQADDSQVGPLINEEKLLWTGAPLVENQIQVLSAGVLISGWDALNKPGFVPAAPPSYRIGLGFSNNEPHRAGIFLAIRGDLKNPGGKGAIVEEDGDKIDRWRHDIDISHLGWAPGTATLPVNTILRLKIWIQTPSGAGKATIKVKVWKDGDTEPKAVSYSDPIEWVWPSGTSVLPALLGGIEGVQGANDGMLSVSFSSIVLESLPDPAVVQPAPVNPAFLTPTRRRSSLTPPDLNEPVFIPIAAITPSWTGRWGTLISQVEPDAPLPLRCVQPPCLWPTPLTSQSACYGLSRTIVATGLLPGIMPADVMIRGVFPAGAQAESRSVASEGFLPPGAPPGTADSIELAPTPDPAPAGETVGPSRPGPNTGWKPATDANLRYSSLRADDIAPATGNASVPASEHQTPETPAAGEVKPHAPDPNLTLPSINVPLRTLRDYGAVATYPDGLPIRPARAPRNPQNDILDALILELAKQTKFKITEVEKKIKMAIESAAKSSTEAQLRDVVVAVNQYRIDEIAMQVTPQRFTNETQILIRDRLRVYRGDHIPPALRDLFSADLKEESDQLASVTKYVTMLNLLPDLVASFVSWEPGGGEDAAPSVDSRDDRARSLRDPFKHAPSYRVIQLTPASRNSALDRDDNGDDDEPLIKPLDQDDDAHLWTYHFDHPARFPRAAFGKKCCAFEGEGAVIHEGMRLLARQDGQYEVRFNITAPSIPVVLRLQLILFARGKPDHGAGQPIPRTLTLPPIVIEPTGGSAFPYDLEAGVHPTSYLVSVKGYSQVIQEVHDDGQGKEHLLLVKRTGTARMGNGVQYQVTR